MAKKKYDIIGTESGEYKTTLNKMYLTRKPYEPVNPKHILSFMPGTVEKLNVKAGESVKEGDSLMIYRAMKMNNNILAPMKGKIKSINVKEGDNLPKDAIMIEFK